MVHYQSSNDGHLLYKCNRLAASGHTFYGCHSRFCDREKYSKKLIPALEVHVGVRALKQGG